MNAAPRTFRRPHLLIVGLGVLLLTLAACGGSTASTTTTPPADLTGSITVSAAASLTATFTQLGDMFRSAHPGTTVVFNFGSSGALATQIQQGAPADVFASASPAVMETVQESGDIEGKPVTFGRNSLEIVVKPGNPFGIHSLADLIKANVVAICVASAPCGATANQALKKAHVIIPASKVSLGQDVDATLSEVTTGDAAAAIVYVTNAKTVGAQGAAVSIHAPVNVTTSYPIAVVKSTTNTSLAQAWITYVLSPTAQKVLRQAGFLPPV